MAGHVGIRIALLLKKINKKKQCLTNSHVEMVDTVFYIANSCCKAVSSSAKWLTS